ncbi:DNA-binding transcriptional regulator, MarR family [Anaerocolumna jejuensis DSM 15929]|uniref:DNA-binding transcriptional regulator, MarR family n=1 Tax=Anaerocolumna jejuensis DSM 15929 TaxID=1121322 RepID=A0A1M6SNZ7_9FIRM|nr:hypothetical protein [Anaerocolumna jejuensis]SHK46472.1 DNA-binding transcriptional regulator, MarR family [Anaerocolumna jejuensis DSM 15929]
MDNNKKSLNELLFYVNIMLFRVQFDKYDGFGPMGSHMEQVLLYLKERDSATSRELLEALDVRPKVLDKCLDRLEEGGFIEVNTLKEADTILEVKLTRKGLKSAGKAEERRAEAEKLFDCLSEEEKENLHRILLRLADSFEAELKEEDFSREDFWIRSGFENFDSFRHRHSFEKSGGNCDRGRYGSRENLRGREENWNRGGCPYAGRGYGHFYEK